MKLHSAAFDGDLERCKSLLKKKWWRDAANVNEIDYQEGTGTPLIVAVLQKHIAIVEFLLQSGAGTEYTDTQGITALGYAVAIGHTAIVELLLNNGANASFVDPSGSTLLHQAALKGHAAVAELLIKHGADVNSTNREELSPLLVCAIQKHGDVADVLLDNGAKVPSAHEMSVLLNKALMKGQYDGVNTPTLNRVYSRSIAKWVMTREASRGEPNVTLLNRTPFQITISFTSREDKTMEYELRPGEEKKVHFDEGSYTLITYSKADKFRTDDIRIKDITQEIFLESQDKLIFEQDKSIEDGVERAVLSVIKEQGSI